MKYSTLAIGLVVCSWCGAIAYGQPQDDAETPRQQVINAFDRKAPQVGQPVGEMDLLDADGGRFDPANLRGRHTVLVFGCLT